MSETGGVDALTNTLINNHFTTCVTDGQGALWYDDNGQSVGTFFAFTNPVNAFGLDLTVDDASSTITIGGSVSTSVFRSPDTPGFFGVIDTAGSFSSISFSASGDPCVGFDAVEYGTAGVIPEPSTLIIWSLLGALGVSAAWWRRRRAA